MTGHLVGVQLAPSWSSSEVVPLEGQQLVEVLKLMAVQELVEVLKLKVAQQLVGASPYSVLVPELHRYILGLQIDNHIVLFSG